MLRHFGSLPASQTHRTFFISVTFCLSRVDKQGSASEELLLMRDRSHRTTGGV